MRSVTQKIPRRLPRLSGLREGKGKGKVRGKVKGFRQSFGSKAKKGKKTKQTKKTKNTKKTTKRMSNREYAQRLFCRSKYVADVICRDNVKYGPACKSANRCAYFKKTTKRSYFNHLKALLSANNDPKTQWGILENLPKEQILEISDDMRKLAEKMEKFMKYL